MELSPEALVDETEPLGLVEPIEPVDAVNRNGRQTWRYRFPPQDFDLGRIGGKLYDPAKQQADPDASPFDWSVGDLVAVDLAGRTVDIKRSIEEPHPRAVVPLPWLQTKDHQTRLYQLGEWVAEHGIAGPGPSRAVRDLLLGVPPRAGQSGGAPLVQANETDLEAARRMALTLDSTVLAVQGPPGAGKTYTGARMIATLLAAGKKVGVTATSHKVISNLLQAVLKAADEDGIEVRAIQRGDADVVVTDARVARAKQTKDVIDALDNGSAALAAGTGWLWASEGLAGALDVLFVDEAGQMSLANVAALGHATDSIVLLGDPQQLDQPQRGTHPPGAERSALAHVLGSVATIPADRGLFLERTWRLHPVLCAFTSEVFYDDRLEPEPHLAAQRIRSDLAMVDGVGPRLRPVETVGADNESPAEADAVADLARSIVGGTWTDAKGISRRIEWGDVLIVAPYNAQVGAIQRRLPPEARVGTVDKFQGQEAPISIYSLTTSSPELAPRGMDFLYSRNRLNVATSRARCVTVVVGSPDLWRVRARTPSQMRLANAFCRFVELASSGEADGGGAAETAASGDERRGFEVLTLDLI
jgi:uncharacterized protein